MSSLCYAGVRKTEVLKVTNNDGKFRQFNACFTNKAVPKPVAVFYVCIANIDFALIYDLRNLFIWRNFGVDLQSKNNSVLPRLDLAILGVLHQLAKFSPHQNFFE